MDTLRNDDLHGLPLELKDESGGQGGGDQNADTDVAAAVARLQTGFDTKMAEMGRDLKAAQDRADAFELRLNRPGGQSAATMPTLTPEQKAFLVYVRAGKDFLAADEAKNLRAAEGPTAGFLAPPEFTTELIRNLVQVSPVRAAARVGTMSAATIYVPKRTSNVTARWVAEIESRPPTEPTFGQVEIVAHEAAAYVDVSNQLLEDSAIDIAAELTLGFGEEFGRIEGNAFILGNGVKKPLGLLGSDALATSVSPLTLAAADYNAAGGTKLADALVALLYSLPTFFRARAAWMMSGPTIGRLRGLKDTTGRYLWQESLSAGEPSTLLGRPVVEAVDMPDALAGAVPILLGDFQRAYRIYDRVGISFLRDPYTLATVGQTRFHARMRVGGSPVQTEAYRGLRIV